MCNVDLSQAVVVMFAVRLSTLLCLIFALAVDIFAILLHALCCQCCHVCHCFIVSMLLYSLSNCHHYCMCCQFVDVVASAVDFILFVVNIFASAATVIVSAIIDVLCLPVICCCICYWLAIAFAVNNYWIWHGLVNVVTFNFLLLSGSTSYHPSCVWCHWSFDVVKCCMMSSLRKSQWKIFMWGLSSLMLYFTHTFNLTYIWYGRPWWLSLAWDFSRLRLRACLDDWL